jgi:hypothetical protein
MGVRAGPVGVYGGGRRRSSSGSGAAFLGFLIVLAIIVFAVMWPLSLFGHAIGLTPSWHQLMNRNHTWMHQHYSLVGLRYLGAAGILLVVLTMLAIPLLASAKPSNARKNGANKRRRRRLNKKAVPTPRLLNGLLAHRQSWRCRDASPRSGLRRTFRDCIQVSFRSCLTS